MTDTVERLQQDIAHLEGENETLAAALVDARIHADAAREEIAGLRQQRDEAEQRWPAKFAQQHEELKLCAHEAEREIESLRAQLAEALKTPDEWCRCLNIDIVDPDGWRREGDPPWSQPLSYDDFMARALRSSQMVAADPALLRADLAEAGTVAEQWSHAAGWASGHGYTLADILREMRSLHCDERRLADLAASGGLPEAQESDAGGNKKPGS